MDGEIQKQVDAFVARSQFENGLLAVDLDGTALLEDRGKVFISSSVERGVRAVHDLNRPVLINTLRFPLSVMTTVGHAWYAIADVPILTILLNGSLLGYIKREGDGLIYEEFAAFPMTADETNAMVDGLDELMRDGITDVVFFFYTRDWRAGESIWTPHPERIDALKRKYVSATTVFSEPLDQLRDRLLKEELCMTSLFVDRPEDTLMAYQHSKRSSFFTRAGVNKASGLRALAEHFGLSLLDSLGAGDTEMDTFLSETGLSVIVGGAPLPFRGKVDTIRVGDPIQLGELLLLFAEAVRRKARA